MEEKNSTKACRNHAPGEINIYIRCLSQRVWGVGEHLEWGVPALIVSASSSLATRCPEGGGAVLGIHDGGIPPVVIILRDGIACEDLSGYLTEALSCSLVVG